MIHSLYSNKETFLRELISNSSDAADKLRFLALSDTSLYEGEGELHLRISVNKEMRTITLSDNGIGMSRQEVVDNLGTIARSGTKSFLKSLQEDQKENSQLIGQFGVGFYSSFIVAEKVSVTTRLAGNSPEQATLWESSGEGDYTISDTKKDRKGTEIVLHLRKGEDEFLDEWRVRNVISKYSDYIAIAVEIETQDKDTQNISWERVNKAQALWIKNKSEISDDDYTEFYKHISYDSHAPIVWSHNRVEGKQEYTSLLYIPSRAPFDMWNRDQKRGLKLYVQRVFIMDDAEYFMPNYLRFVKGLIDSNNLPLNVSREILQDNRTTQNLRTALTKRVLQTLSKLASESDEKYQAFWQEFGLVLKEGPAEDPTNKEAISKLLRFASTKNDSSAQRVSLSEYVKHMAKSQEKIYYITADSYASAKSNPHLELFQKKGLEVLLLSDRIDEWMVSYLTEFEGKQLQSVSKVDDSLSKLEDEEKNEEQSSSDQEKLSKFIERVKNSLGERVKSVQLTYRLTETPSIVTTEANEMSTQMAKLLSAAGQEVSDVKYIFELNPDHRLVKHITDIESETLFDDWIELLLDQALLAERGTLDNPNQFIHRINQLLTT
jgi:molecular chaperone HtpG